VPESGLNMFQPLAIKGVHFRNRILRSSMGGRGAYYDGTVNNAWKNFEVRFARTGVAAIISATMDVDDKRLSPLEYPKLSDDSFIEPLRRAVRAVQNEGCKYIMQIGDPGGHTQTSLLPQVEDGKSASGWFDLFYGYRNRATAMTTKEVEQEVVKFADAARRVREIGCDGVEVTASKGYIIHQFLNPATNRRTDRYGGSVEARFQLLKEVVQAVRERVGRDFLFGVRLSAKDYNYLPALNCRLPLVWPLRHYWMGNTLKETLEYGRKLEELGVDYLHIDSGFGFINPKGNPGTYPLDGLRIFANSTRHLSVKARVRAGALNLIPAPVARAVLGIGWKSVDAPNAGFAGEFKRRLHITVIANGGFRKRDVIENALGSQCDLVAMARPLLANPDLLEHFRVGTEPQKPCSWCNQCCTRTAVMPLGCYERSRFNSQDEMEAQILAWSADPTP
jgi:2,4-dienoyl-CoA reductase-like NADH-dependent reductase (Old Yellow Enzyme family)